MRFLQHNGFYRLLSVASAGAAVLCLSTMSAHAAYTVVFQQVGPNVVATGSGTISTIGLSPINSTNLSAEIGGANGIVSTGPTTATSVRQLATITGPNNFGASPPVAASSGSGDEVGIYAAGGSLFLPSGYAAGTALSDTSTYLNETFAALGITPGTYVYTWGSVDGGDSFTLQIGSNGSGGSTTVPEPASAILLGCGLLGYGLRRATRA